MSIPPTAPNEAPKPEVILNTPQKKEFMQNLMIIFCLKKLEKIQILHQARKELTQDLEEEKEEEGESKEKKAVPQMDDFVTRGLIEIYNRLDEIDSRESVENSLILKLFKLYMQKDEKPKEPPPEGLYL